MLKPRTSLLCGVIPTLLCCSIVGRTQTTHGQLYVTDYGNNTLDRFTYTLTAGVITNIVADGVGNSTSNAALITGGIYEGVVGTGNDIIAVTTGNALQRYTLNGASLGTITVLNNGFTGGAAGNTAGGTHTFSGVGNMLISPDGKTLYIAEETGNVIDSIDLKTGKITNQATFHGAHDIWLSADGKTLFAAAYSGHDTASQGVWQFTAATLAKNPTPLITYNTNGLTSPTGMTVVTIGANQFLYVTQNVNAGDSSIKKYTLTDPSGVAGYSAAFVSSTTPSGTVSQAYVGPTGNGLTDGAAKKNYTDLYFAFGLVTGPDNNIYSAVLGSGQSTAADTVPGPSSAPVVDYYNGIYAFNTTTNASSLAVGGWKNTNTDGSGAGSAATDGFYSPKYLQFDTNFTTAIDAGTPEPGSVALGLSMGLTFCVSAARYRRKRNRR